MSARNEFKKLGIDIDGGEDEAIVFVCCAPICVKGHYVGMDELDRRDRSDRVVFGEY